MSDSSPHDSQRLDPNEILRAEFDYIAQTAFQANEDRARIASYYLITAGAIVAGIAGITIDASASKGVYWGFAVIFVVLGLIGVLTLLQLARLRSAWTESVRAMNVIKEFYIAHSVEPNLEQAFAWRLASIPAPGKRWSVAFLLALSIILIDSIMLSTAVIFAGLGLGSGSSDSAVWGWAGLAALAFALLQYRAYFQALRG